MRAIPSGMYYRASSHAQREEHCDAEGAEHPECCRVDKYTCSRFHPHLGVDGEERGGDERTESPYGQPVMPAAGSVGVCVDHCGHHREGDDDDGSEEDGECDNEAHTLIPNRSGKGPPEHNIPVNYILTQD